jgi:hypothetical protein
MIARASLLGIRCVGAFTSGPFADLDWIKPQCASNSGNQHDADKQADGDADQQR